MQTAVIDESLCIGCTLCIKACPVDAIVGTHTFMHTVIEHECIGCKLCVAPCPVDCIAMVATQTPRTAHDRTRFARERRKRQNLRLELHAQQYAATTQRRREELKATIRRKTGAPGTKQG